VASATDDCLITLAIPKEAKAASAGGFFFEGRDSAASKKVKTEFSSGIAACRFPTSLSVTPCWRRQRESASDIDCATPEQ
jgi:hypothetical protein